MPTFGLIEGHPSDRWGKCFNAIVATTKQDAEGASANVRVVENTDETRVVVGLYYDFEDNAWLTEEEYMAAFAQYQAEQSQG